MYCLVLLPCLESDHKSLLLPEYKSLLPHPIPHLHIPLSLINQLDVEGVKKAREDEAHLGPRELLAYAVVAALGEGVEG